MEVTPVDVARVPTENLRVPVADFAAVWAAAEAQADQPTASAWYVAGVVDTFRWLARATIRPDAGPWFSAPAPVSGRRDRALPEAIEAEWLIAQTLTSALSDEAALDHPSRIEGVAAAFAWAWCGTGTVPVFRTGYTRQRRRQLVSPLRMIERTDRRRRSGSEVNPTGQVGLRSVERRSGSLGNLSAVGQVRRANVSSSLLAQRRLPMKFEPFLGSDVRLDGRLKPSPVQFVGGTLARDPRGRSVRKPECPGVICLAERRGPQVQSLGESGRVARLVAQAMHVRTRCPAVRFGLKQHGRRAV